MKKENFILRAIRTKIFLIVLIFFACLTSAQAQTAGTVIPTVCIKPNLRFGTTTVAENAAANATNIRLDISGGNLPQNIRAVINPGGATEEIIEWSYALSSNGFSLRTVKGSPRPLTYAHSAGETVQWLSDATIYWGYKNLNNSNSIIPKGILTNNYFSPGPTTYGFQTTAFLPGVHRAFSFDFPTRDGLQLHWFLNGGAATASKNTPECAEITYQGRLSDAGGAANGQYDLQFTAYDAPTGGAAQSEVIAVENAVVANGIFTVQLDFGAAFHGGKAKFLEIAVRPGASSGNDPFTILTPRQPLTSVPYAVNADTATNVSGGFVQLPLTSGAPTSEECRVTSQYGRQKFDASEKRLYICAAGGWSSIVVQ